MLILLSKIHHLDQTGEKQSNIQTLSQTTGLDLQKKKKSQYHKEKYQNMYWQ